VNGGRVYVLALSSFSYCIFLPSRCIGSPAAIPDAKIKRGACVCVCCAKGRVERVEQKKNKICTIKEIAVTITSDMHAMSALLLLLLLLLLSEQERLQVRARVGAVFRKYG